MLARHQGRSNLRHLPNNKKPGTNLIMVDSDIPMEKFSSPVEHKLFIWSFMEPPRISKPTPIVSAERYERVRKMLDKPYEDDARETHIKSNLTLNILPDGTVIKTKSKTEIRAYDPIQQPPRFAEYCTPVCEKVQLDEIPCEYEKFMDEKFH